MMLAKFYYLFVIPNKTEISKIRGYLCLGLFVVCLGLCFVWFVCFHLLGWLFFVLFFFTSVLRSQLIFLLGV